MGFRYKLGTACRTANQKQRYLARPNHVHCIVIIA